MTFNIGDKVTSLEHPNEVGEITRMVATGYIVEFTMQPNEMLPYGSINSEFWPFEDAAKDFTKVSK